MNDAQIASRVTDLVAGNRTALSRTVTMIESSRLDHKVQADKIMRSLLH